MTESRRQVAYFSPLPPTRSGIADYSAELLPYLAKAARITLFTATPEQVAEDVCADFELVKCIRWLQ